MIDEYRATQLFSMASECCARLGENAYDLVPHPETGRPVPRWHLVADQMHRHLIMVNVLRNNGMPACARTCRRTFTGGSKSNANAARIAGCSAI